MSSNNSSRKVVTVDEQAFEKADEQAVDEDGFPVVDETPEFEATVDEEIQAKVDANHPDGIADTSEDRIHGVTLEQEERIQAREAELAHISAQAELGTQEGREKRTRVVAAQGSKQRRRASWPSNGPRSLKRYRCRQRRERSFSGPPVVGQGGTGRKRRSVRSRPRRGSTTSEGTASATNRVSQRSSTTPTTRYGWFQRSR